MAILYLAKAGYGTPAQIAEWDTEDFLDALEYEAIGNAIDRHRVWETEQQNKTNRK